MSKCEWQTVKLLEDNNREIFMNGYKMQWKYH